MGAAALVLGIVSIVFSFLPLIPYWLGLVVGVLGVVLAAIAKKNGQKGVATAGLVLSIIGAALCGVMWIACAACASAVENAGEKAVEEAFKSLG